MSLLTPRLDQRVQLRQTLTPGLVQMVTVLQLNALELRDMITQEIEKNPVLEEIPEGGEELTQQEVQALVEAERDPHPADEAVLQSTREAAAESTSEFEDSAPEAQAPAATVPEPEPESETPIEATQPADPFEQTDFGTYWDEWMDPGFASPGTENPDKASFETFLPTPVTLIDHLRTQLSYLVLSDPVRDAADTIVGNLEDSGYLGSSLEELAGQGPHTMEDLDAALRAVQSLEPAGVGARDLRECLLLQLESRNGRGGVAWQIVNNHLKLVESKNIRELARVLGRPMEHIQIALRVIRTLNPRPGLRYSDPGARQVEPDVTIAREGTDYVITLNDDDMPQLRLNGQYRRMLDRDNQPDKEVRNYVRERYASALQLIRNIEQRKQTILRVCQSIVNRQIGFLENGIDQLKPMMIKEVAEEIGVHPSTVSRAVASKYAHTPQGVFELRYFFSEAVQGHSGADTPLLVLKRKVKKMIEDEDSAHPLTDDQITARLQAEGIQVTRRTVAKYREDMKIPSTHHRRVRS
jgi:RNA polymerase sigma-54 factor